MAETDAHRRELIAALDALTSRYADREDVYVAGDLFIYYEEGNPQACFAPDVFVVFGVPKRERRVFKLWEEGVAPAFVLELSSKGTWLEDAGKKKVLCERFGVAEYFLFDPEADYLDPPLQGFRRVGSELRVIEPDEHGVFRSEALGLSLHLENLRLVLVDLQTGERLLRFQELEVAKRDAEVAKRDAEVAKRDAEVAKRDAEVAGRDAEAAKRRAEVARDEAEVRACAAEDEVARLRAELAKHDS